MARPKGALGKKTLAKIQAASGENKSTDAVAVLDAPAAPQIEPEAPEEFHGKDVANSACKPPDAMVESLVDVDLVIDPVETRELKMPSKAPPKSKPEKKAEPVEVADESKPPPEPKQESKPLVEKVAPIRDGPDHRYFAWLGRRSG